jgi:hypothetical protein
MSDDLRASQDFEWALAKAFWRRVLNWVKGSSNKLLPFDEVRQRLDLRGQHYAGMRQVPIDQIVGSTGRYLDFDRAFLPLQGRTRDRWISIDKAHYQDVILPPVELLKVGEAYFVKDGNHRVSVARERGQAYIDAYVIEIDVPVPVTPDASLDELALKQESFNFFKETHLDETRPGASFETAVNGQYQRLLEHISVHRWYLGEQRQQAVELQAAAESWYDNVYLPVVELIRSQNLLRSFPGYTETDLYLWIVTYQGYLRDAYQDEAGLEPIDLAKGESSLRATAGRQIKDEFPLGAVGKLVNLLKRSNWVDIALLRQEQAGFFRRTLVNELYPEERFEATIPGQYERLLEHIRAHRWYLGEQRQQEVSFQDAVQSWYENVYRPLVVMVREQGILKDFPGRTETDLYLWIMSHRWFLQNNYGSDVSVEKAAEQFREDYASRRKKGKGKSD